MLKKIALATLTAAALVAPPSLAHAAVNGITLNGLALNGVQLVNGVSVNGLMDRVQMKGVEPADREVHFVGAQADGDSSTVLTIELPQDGVTR